MCCLRLFVCFISVDEDGDEYGLRVKADRSTHRIPFYIAMPYSTIDRKLPNGDGIPIEQRSADEIAHCPGAQVYNPAFDVTPHDLITGYITERGILTRP